VHPIRPQQYKQISLGLEKYFLCRKSCTPPSGRGKTEIVANCCRSRSSLKGSQLNLLTLFFFESCRRSLGQVKGCSWQDSCEGRNEGNSAQHATQVLIGLDVLVMNCLQQRGAAHRRHTYSSRCCDASCALPDLAVFIVVIFLGTGTTHILALPQWQ
jgi:hypothetical protein